MTPLQIRKAFFNGENITLRARVLDLGESRTLSVYYNGKKRFKAVASFVNSVKREPMEKVYAFVKENILRHDVFLSNTTSDIILDTEEIVGEEEFKHGQATIKIVNIRRIQLY